MAPHAAAPRASYPAGSGSVGSGGSGLKARERILEAAYELFSRHGIRAVGIDTIVESSGVARMTLYRHFASKDALVLAFLERREEAGSRTGCSAK